MGHDAVGPDPTNTAIELEQAFPCSSSSALLSWQYPRLLLKHRKSEPKEYHS